jgi:hypothetical protein
MQLEEYIEAFEFAHKEFHEALDDLAKMKAERDEARKEVCLWQGLDTGKTSEEVAKVRGWDCYKAEFFVGDDDHAKEGL